MSASENGSSPSSGAGSRKEKKKQAKEERDRLKQVEKKKRRLEKALATATAIRMELEKKKQRRKEEEQRLDEEGAALAEAVALQVLVEEEVNSIDDSVFENVACNVSNCAVLRKAFMSVTPSDLSQPTSGSSNASDEAKSEARVKEVSVNSTFVCNDVSKEVKKTLLISDWEVFSNPRDSLLYSSERAKAAELAAGLAAAQAVAALRIAEEARAEAEAAKKAAQAAICQVMDRQQIAMSETDQQVTVYPTNIEMERDELKARLEESERQLKEKTQQVFHLEQSLEDMTQYLFCLKATLPLPRNDFENEKEISERGSANITESSQGTTNQ